MKQNRKQGRELERKGYEVFKGYSIKAAKKKVDLEQDFIVPWEMKGNKHRFVYSKS